jgi:protein phosphatase
MFLNHLLRPKEWQKNVDDPTYFAFRREHIMALADEAQKVLESQPMVLRVDAPVKVFGDIHGQYQDLMRFFDLWGTPDENGDIESYDYIFLGDYVDRGNHSLETICLLMALKIKFPDKIHLLRGNHEDKWINNAFGFAEECSTRLSEDPNDHDSVN